MKILFWIMYPIFKLSKWIDKFLDYGFNEMEIKKGQEDE